MKKITTVFAMLLMFAASAMAQTTVEWNTAPNFKPNDNASVYYVGITTPGTTDATYTMTAFSFYENSGYGAAEAYTVISKTAPSADNGWLVPEEDVLGISNENTTPTAEGFIDYTIAGDEGASLQGGTTYYMVFVKSNETNDGFYEVGTQRVRLQNNSSYPAGVCLSNGAFRTDLIAAFKATLTTNDAFNVTWTAVSLRDNQPFDQGVMEGVVGAVTIPTFEGSYQYSHTTLADGSEFDVTQDITENTELIFYYNPLLEIEYVVRNANGDELAYKTIPEVWGSTITKLPTDLDQSLFYDYSEINFVVDGYKTVEVTATQKKDPLIAFNEDETGELVYNRLALKGNNYLHYAADDYPNVSLSTTLTEDETSEWAFIGNPYDGFQIKNHAAGNDFVLGSEDPTQDGRTGGDTFATLGGDQTYETWFPKASSSYVNGFFLFNEDNYALNMRDGKLAYWTSGYDAGSTFVATKIKGSEELLAEAQHLLEELTAGANEVQIGYPNADALAAFDQALKDAAEAISVGEDDKTVAENIKAAIAEVQSSANAVYTPRTDVYYTITNARGSMIYDPAHVEDLDADGNEFLWITNSLDKDDANHQWGFVEEGGVYYMYNVGKMQFANVTQSGSYQGDNGDKHTWMFSNAPSSVTLDAGIEDCVATPNVRVLATSAVTGKQYAMSISPSYKGPVISYDAKNDGGVPMKFAIATTTQNEEVTAAIAELLNDIAPYREALDAAINRGNEYLNELAEYPIGEDLNEYTMEGSTDALSSAISAGQAVLANENATKDELSAAINAISEAKDAITLTLNMPQAGMWLRFTSAHGTYLSGVPVENGRMSLVYESDGSTVFYYDGEKLTSLDLGLAVRGANAGKVGVEGVSYWFEESTKAAGKYAVRFNPDGGSNRYLWAWDDSKGHADQNSSDADNCVFVIENVKELPLTMTHQDGDKYFAAISLPTAVASVNGAQVQNVFMSGDKAVYEPAATKGICANMGVLLMGGNEVVTLVLGECDEAPDNNVLLPLEQSVADFTEGLVLSNPEGTLGFWEPEIAYGLDEEENEIETKPVRGFTAYLPIETAGTNGVELVQSSDGIETIDNGATTENGAVFNLQGQKVNKAQKGVYIINNKKVVVK